MGPGGGWSRRSRLVRRRLVLGGGGSWLSGENIWLPFSPLPKSDTTIFANWSSKSFHGF